MRRVAVLAGMLALGCGRLGYGLEGLPDVAGDASMLPDAASRDAALDASWDASADAAPEDAAGRDACVPSAEACNGRDDDCDGASDETFSVVATWGACETAARGGATTLLTFTFDREDAVRQATVVEGGVEIAQVGTLATPGAAMLDPARTIANLLLPPATSGARWLPFPAVGGDLDFEPNVTRTAVEVSWGDWAVRDGPGDDLLILEHGNPISEPEGFAISVHDAHGGGWSRVRYEHFDAYSDPDRLFATAYDLAELGLAGGVVDRVRVHNIFGGEAVMPDRVTEPSGEGFVVRGDEPEHATAHPLTTSAGGAQYPTDLLDTDLLFVVALHPTVAPRCCVAP